MISKIQTHPLPKYKSVAKTSQSPKLFLLGDEEVNYLEEMESNQDTQKIHMFPKELRVHRGRPTLEIPADQPNKDIIDSQTIVNETDQFKGNANQNKSLPLLHIQPRAGEFDPK